MSDLIDRKAAVDAVVELIDARYKWKDFPKEEIEGLIAARMAIEDLPSAQPERLQFDCDMAYMQGKTDGIRECTEQLRKLKIKMEVEHE